MRFRIGMIPAGLAGLISGAGIGGTTIPSPREQAAPVDSRSSVDNSRFGTAGRRENGATVRRAETTRPLSEDSRYTGDSRRTEDVLGEWEEYLLHKELLAELRRDRTGLAAAMLAIGIGCRPFGPIR